jgi:hydrogenase maturation protease
MEKRPRITILGVGNILFGDEGFGVKVLERLARHYSFPDHVQLVDGGVLGVGLMGLIADTDVLIVVDAVRNRQPAGTLYRLQDQDIPQRILAKTSMHQVDLPEVLALCAAIDKQPATMVVVGVEPEDMTTMSLELTPTVRARVDDAMAMVLTELKQLGVRYTSTLSSQDDKQNGLA